MESITWIFSAVTAIWFGVMARRAGRSWILWGLVGAVFALVTTTIVLGLWHSTFIPMSHQAVVRFHIKSVVTAAAVVGGPGWLFTLGLQSWHHRLWKPKGREGQAIRKP